MQYPATLKISYRSGKAKYGSLVHLYSDTVATTISKTSSGSQTQAQSFDGTNNLRHLTLQLFLAGNDKSIRKRFWHSCIQISFLLISDFYIYIENFVN